MVTEKKKKKIKSKVKTSIKFPLSLSISLIQTHCSLPVFISLCSFMSLLGPSNLYIDLKKKILIKLML